MMAGFMLLVWPVITLVLVARNGMALGLIWGTIAGYLFLPEAYGFDLPGLLYNKRAAIALSLLLVVLTMGGRDRRPEVKTGDSLLRGLLALLTLALFASPIFTVLNNQYPLMNGNFLRAALGTADLLGMTLEVLMILMPFFIAKRWLARPGEQISFMHALVILGIVYSFLALIEIRMSPQMSNWVYGFFPHSFGQHARGGSWRPLVFLNHGLELGFFLFMSVIAAFTLTRTGTRDTRMVMTIAGCWLFGILLISSNTGAAMLAILFVPVLLFLPLRMQLMMASIIAVIFLIYPMLRQADILPMDSVVQGFSLISEDRARSFEFRVRNEDILLERAYEKPLFGWGPWARGQVFNDRGDMISVPDGIWIITLGNRGWVGFLTFFGLLAVPLLHLGRAARRKTLSAPTAGLAIMAAGNLMYMVPNSTVSPISAMMFGLLAGYAQWDAVRAPEETEEGSASKDPPLRGVPRYTRFAPGEGSRVTRREIKPRG